jgi:hypothetical protein
MFFACENDFLLVPKALPFMFAGGKGALLNSSVLNFP